MLFVKKKDEAVVAWESILYLSGLLSVNKLSKSLNVH